MKAKEKLSDIARAMDKRGEGRTAFTGDVALGLDTPTRWNSTLDMLLTLARMKHPISKLKAIAEREKMTVPSQESFLSDDEWTTVIVLIDALAPFQGATLDLSSERYPALGSTFVIFQKIIRHCAKLSEQPLPMDVKSLVRSLQEETTMRFNFLSKYNKYLANLSMIVDPRLKLKYIKSEDDKEVIKNDLIAHITKYYRDPSSLPISPSRKRKRVVENSIMDMLSDDEDERRVDETPENEVTRWLAHGCEDLSTNVFKWFELNAHSYPRLAQAARDLLLISGTSVPSERGFSLAGVQVSDKRCSLNPETVQALMCLKSWYRHDLKNFAQLKDVMSEVA